MPKPRCWSFSTASKPGVWEQSAGEKNLAVLERIVTTEKAELISRACSTSRSRHGIRTLRSRRWIPTCLGCSPGLRLFSIALFVASVYLLAGDWAQVQRDTAALYTFQGKTAYDIWVFWFLLLGLGGIHELGHGLTCKHFGGDVHQMGLLLIYFTPAFYTDTTDIVLFDETARRQWVLFAGIWIELVICGIATFFWRFTAAGSLR